MTITGGSALPKEDIDRMVKEAEAHAEEDKKRREDADTRNPAEQAGLLDREAAQGQQATSCPRTSTPRFQRPSTTSRRPSRVTTSRP